jgi:hypothetical protein
MNYLCGCLAVTVAVFAFAGCGGTERDPKDFLLLEKGMSEGAVKLLLGEPDSIETKKWPINSNFKEGNLTAQDQLLGRGNPGGYTATSWAYWDSKFSVICVIQFEDGEIVHIDY